MKDKISEKEAILYSPTFIWGCQRSGTTALGYVLSLHPTIEYFSEYDTRAFDDYDNVLLPRKVINSLLNKYSNKLCLFKPICMSHKALEILSTYKNSKGVWIFRNPHAVVNSMANDMERSAEYVPEEIEQVRSINLLKYFEEISFEMTSNSKHIDDLTKNINIFYLCWLLKNSLYFYLGLDKNPNVILLHYSSLIESKSIWDKIFRFLDLSPIHHNLYNKQNTLFKRYEGYIPLVEQCEIIFKELLYHYKSRNILDY